MKLFYSIIIVFLLAGCQYTSNFFSTSAFKIQFPSKLPQGYSLDTLKMGVFNDVEDYDKKYINSNDSQIYIYSIVKNSDKKFKDRISLSFFNFYYPNDSMKSERDFVKDKISFLINESAKLGDKSYEIISPVKDTIISNRKITYCIYQHDYETWGGAIYKQKTCELYISKENKILSFYFTFWGNDEEFTNEFNELMGIFTSIKIE